MDIWQLFSGHTDSQIKYWRCSRWNGFGRIGPKILAVEFLEQANNSNEKTPRQQPAYCIFANGCGISSFATKNNKQTLVYWFQRSWVRIPAPYTGLTYFHIYLLLKIVLFVGKDLKK